MEQKVSVFHLHSLGIVAENKALDSYDVEVTPIEKFPMTDGEISSNATTETVKSENSDGKPYQVPTTSTPTVKATWMPLGMSNRKTAPDVRRGAQVVLYRVADTDEYWWVTAKDDLDLIKLETVVYAFSGTKDEGAKSDATNTYFLEISTHQGHVIFHTSKANQEPFGYDIQLNTQTGFFQLQDDVGNVISLTSAKNQIEMINQNGAFVNILGANISINAPSTLNIKAPNFNIQSSTCNWNVGNLTVTATTTWNGSIQQAGNLQTVDISATQVTASTGFNGNLNGNANTASALL